MKAPKCHTVLNLFVKFLSLLLQFTVNYNPKEIETCFGSAHIFAYASTKRLKVCKPHFHGYLLIYLIILIINVNHFDSRRELTVSYFFCLLFRYEQLSKEEKNVEMLHSVQEAKWYSATD